MNVSRSPKIIVSRLRPTSAVAQYNVGTTLEAARRFADARTRYEAATACAEEAAAPAHPPARAD